MSSIRINNADIHIGSDVHPEQLATVMQVIAHAECLNSFGHIYIARGYTDLRYGIDGLASVVKKIRTESVQRKNDFPVLRPEI